MPPRKSSRPSRRSPGQNQDSNHGHKPQSDKRGRADSKRARDQDKVAAAAEPRKPGTELGRRSRPRKDRLRDSEGPFYLYGIHAVEAALNNPARQLEHLKLTPNAAGRLSNTLQSSNIAREQVKPGDLDRLLGRECVHQGTALLAQPLPEPSLQELAEAAQDGRPLLVLDQITDPHNLGAILRSCAVFGAAGLITTRRNSPPLTGTVAKTASGGLEHVGVALVPNLARAIDQLKQMGIHIIGLDGGADNLLQAADFNGPTALVLGAEGAGLRRLTLDKCDVLCAIAAPGPIVSLNVSNAAAVCLHLAATCRSQ